MITTKDIQTAARLSDEIYSLEERQEWHTVPGTNIRMISAPLSRNKLGMCGTVEAAYQIDRETIYIAFSGTEAPENWYYNIDYKSVRYYGYYIHEGFLQLTLEVMSALLREGELHRALAMNGIEKIVYTGHSAGGAVAGIMPILLGLQRFSQYVIDFGCPKYLADGEKSINEVPYERVRFCNSLDVVPYLPLLRGYQHFGTAIDTTVDTAWKYIDAITQCRVLREIINQHSAHRYAVESNIAWSDYNNH